MIEQKRIPSVSEVSKNFIKYNWILPLKKKPFMPVAMCLYVTYRCNMRCQMCGIWKLDSSQKSNEFSLAELEKILSDPLFAKLEFININGGEPNLRDDLVDIVQILIKRFPRLKTITMNSNGLPPDKTIRNVENISEICNNNTIRFSVSISLHQIGKGYDKIAGVKNAYTQVKESFDGLKQLRETKNAYVSANCVITDLNIRSLSAILEWSRKENIPVNFTLGEIRERFNNLDFSDEITIKKEHLNDLVDFFKSLSKSKKAFMHHTLRYKQLADMLESNKTRSLACHYAMGGIILGSDSSLYYCKNSKAIGNCKDKPATAIYFADENLRYRKDQLIKKRCLSCPPNTFNKIEAEKDLLKLIKFFVLNN
jgi:MoaA/NifB/PqqE/SkfB family radical SAM enzyme